MAACATFQAEAPGVAAVATRLWPGITALDNPGELAAGGDVFAIAYPGPVRADGSPRVHPFCPIIAGGRLVAAIPRSSPKVGTCGGTRAA